MAFLHGGNAGLQVLQVDWSATGRIEGKGSSGFRACDFVKHVPAACVIAKARRVGFDACDSTAPLEHIKCGFLEWRQAVECCYRRHQHRFYAGVFMIFGWS